MDPRRERWVQAVVNKSRPMLASGADCAILMLTFHSEAYGFWSYM